MGDVQSVLRGAPIIVLVDEQRAKEGGGDTPEASDGQTWVKPTADYCCVSKQSIKGSGQKMKKGLFFLFFWAIYLFDLFNDLFWETFYISATKPVKPVLFIMSKMFNLPSPGKPVCCMYPVSNFCPKIST